MTMEIPVGHGYVAFIDDADWSLVSPYRWRVRVRDRGTPYVHATILGKQVSMHRFLMHAERGQMLDHCNGNGLDNRRSNLRFCTHTQNMWNKKVNKRSTSGLKGINFQPSRVKTGRKGWVARLKFQGKVIKLGTFNTPVEAARAYNNGALKYFGEFARLNEIA